MGYDGVCTVLTSAMFDFMNLDEKTYSSAKTRVAFSRATQFPCKILKKIDLKIQCVS